MITKLDPVWVLYLENNPYAFAVFALLAAVAMLRLLVKSQLHDLAVWALSVALVIAVSIAALGGYVIWNQQPSKVASNSPSASPSASAAPLAKPVAPRNVQVVQGNNNTVISE